MRLLTFLLSNEPNSDDDDDRAFKLLLEQHLNGNLPSGNSHEDEVESDVPVIDNDEGEPLSTLL